MTLHGQSVREAALEVLAAVPPYAGLAIYVEGEREAFFEAEQRVVRALDALRTALDAGEGQA